MSSIVLTCPSCRTDNNTPATQLLGQARCQRCQQALKVNAPVELTRDSVDGVLKSSPIPVLLVFSSQWSSPSQMLAPVLDEVARRYGGRLLVGRVNTDMNPDVMKRYGATALPALIMFRGGNEKKRVLGVHSTVEVEQLLSDTGFTR